MYSCMTDYESHVLGDYIQALITVKIWFQISGFALCKIAFTPVTAPIVLRNALNCVSVVVLPVRSP